MKNAIIFLMSTILLSFYTNSFAINQENNFKDKSDDNEVYNDMFSDYINQNSSDSDQKSTEMYENQYSFEFYPYINMKYVSKNLKDKDIVESIDKK